MCSRGGLLDLRNEKCGHLIFSIQAEISYSLLLLLSFPWNVSSRQALTAQPGAQLSPTTQTFPPALGPSWSRSLRKSEQILWRNKVYPGELAITTLSTPSSAYLGCKINSFTLKNSFISFIIHKAVLLFSNP